MRVAQSNEYHGPRSTEQTMFIRCAVGHITVSNTHLDVYKRQAIIETYMGGFFMKIYVNVNAGHDGNGTCLLYTSRCV